MAVVAGCGSRHCLPKPDPGRLCSGIPPRRFASGTVLTNTSTLTVVDTILTDSGSVLNNGTIVVDPSTVTLASLTGTGQALIDAGSALAVLGAVAPGETIGFAAATSLLSLEHPIQVQGTIRGFGSGDLD